MLWIRSLAIGLVLTVVYLAGAGVNSPAAAEEGDRPAVPVERAIVELVLIEAHVTDSGGRPIRDLEADDFVLQIDGRVRPIDSIQYRNIAGPLPAARAAGPDPSSLPAGEAFDRGPPSPPADSGFPRSLVLFFDDDTSSSSGMTRARRAAIEFLGSDLAPSDRVAAISYGRHLEVMYDFTTDRDALRRTIAAGLDDNDRVSDLALEEISRYEELLRALQDNLSGLTGTSTTHLAAFLADSFASQEAARYRKLLLVLRSLVDSMSSWPGYKAIIFMGDGIPRNPGTSYFELLYEADPDPGLLLRATHHDLSLEHKTLIHAAAGAGVTIHTLKTRGLEAGSPMQTAGLAVSARVELNAASSRNHSLKTIALNTGGIASISNDLLRGLNRVEAGSREYYLLGYVPDGPPDGLYHTVHLRVKRRGADLRWRRGFRRLLPAEARIRAIEAAHLLPEFYRGIVAELLVVKGPADSAGRVNDLVVHLPPGEILFLPGPDGPVAQIEIGLVASDRAGRDVLRLARHLNVGLGKDRGGVPGLNLVTRLWLPDDARSVTTVIQDLSSGIIGAARRTLQPTSDNAQVLGLSLYSLAERSLWIEIDPGSGAHPDASGHPGHTLGPALKQGFREGEPLACGFRIDASQDRGRNLKLEVRRAAQSEAVIDVEVASTDQDESGAFEIEVPGRGLTPGRYSLVVLELTEEGLRVDRASLEFEIIPDGKTPAAR